MTAATSTTTAATTAATAASPLALLDGGGSTRRRSPRQDGLQVGLSDLQALLGGQAVLLLCGGMVRGHALPRGVAQPQHVLGDGVALCSRELKILHGRLQNRTSFHSTEHTERGKNEKVKVAKNIVPSIVSTSMFLVTLHPSLYHAPT